MSYQKEYIKLLEKIWLDAKSKFGEPTEWKVDKRLEKIREHLAKLDSGLKNYIVRIEQLLEDKE